jgi:hypothetical protein
VTLLAVGCLAATLACSSKSSEGSAAGSSAASSAGAAVATLNAKCPVMGNAVTAEGGTVAFKGQSIGFCCDGCAPKFAKLSETEKVAALAKNGTTLPK